MMTIEEKARAYDEVRKKITIRFGSNVAGEIFSQFEMSEDEKIGKDILAYLKGEFGNGKKQLTPYTHEILKWYAWLEKQGEKDEEILILKDQIESLHAAIKAVKETHRIELEKQGEQNLANSAKTCKDGQEPADKIQLGKKYKCIASPRYSTFMTGKIYKPEDKFLCRLMNFCSDCFEPIEDGEHNPAEIEKGAKGNEAEIPNSAWSKEDEKIYQSIMDDTVQENQLDGKQIDWLRDIKYRHFPQPKQKWSEENEKDLGDALWCCKQAVSIAKDENDMGNIWYAEHWLKDLKERYTWKPSDRELGAILAAVGDERQKGSDVANELLNIYQQLKKLREE